MLPRAISGERRHLAHLFSTKLKKKNEENNNNNNKNLDQRITAHYKLPRRCRRANFLGIELIPGLLILGSRAEFTL